MEKRNGETLKYYSWSKVGLFRWRSPGGWVARLLLLTGMILLFASPVEAGTGSITMYNLNSSSWPNYMVAGPDNNLWFTDNDYETPAIGKVNSTTGEITKYSTGLNSGSVPNYIVAGPDGSLWFADGGTTPAIGKVNPATGAIAEYSIGLNSGSAPNYIVTGPDGNLWFTDNGSIKAIGKIDPATGAITEYSEGLAGSDLYIIVAGPDGNLWFTDCGSTRAIGKIDPATGDITKYTAGLDSGSVLTVIAAGPDGNLWFTEGGVTRAIGKVDPATGVITEYTTGLTHSSLPNYIVAGPDGNLWFTDNGSTIAVGRINPTTGAITEYATGSGSPGLYNIVASPDGNIWAADYSTSTIYSVNSSTGSVTPYDTGVQSYGYPNFYLVAAPDGSIWFADSYTPAIGRIHTAVSATADAANNTCSVSPGTVLVGGSVTLTASGDRQSAEGSVVGDERYIPTAWTSTESGKNGIFTHSGGSYTSSYTSSAAGSYTVAFTFQKQSWDGSAWADVSGATDTKTTTLTVAAVPTDFICAAASTSTVGFSFTAAGGGDAISLKLMVSSDGGATWNMAATSAALSGSSASTIATGLTPGTSYSFKLTVSDGTNSGDSNAVSVTTCTSTPGTLSGLAQGDIVKLGGKNWIVLNPGTGYLMLKEYCLIRSFDLDSSKDTTAVFDPTSLTNAAYYINNTFLSSLSAVDQALIQDKSWTTGSRTNEAASTVSCKVGLISYNEFLAYYNASDIYNNTYYYWTRTPSGFGIWTVFPHGGLLNDGAYYDGNSIRPTVYLSPSTVIFGSGTSENPYVVEADAGYIAAYSIPGQISSVIDAAAHTVDVTMPAGTSVTGLVAAFSLTSGASATVDAVAQTSGTTSNDYTTPRTYVVAAQNGETKNWVVTIHVGTAASAANNTYSISLSNVLVGSTATITAAGDRQSASGSVVGDERYIPVSWTSTESGKSGAFNLSDSSFTSSYVPSAAGIYTVTIIYQKQSWDGSAWADVSGDTDVKTTTLTASAAFVPVTGITGVPSSATAGTDLTLTGTVAPSDATNQSIAWSVKSAGTTGATVSGNTLSTTSAGIVTVTATIINGATASTDYTRDFDITVNAAPVVDATINPVIGSFDKKNGSQTDVTTTITWGSASGISDVKAGGTSIGAGNYSVSVNTLTIKKEYLATQPIGSLVLTAEFNAGASATLTIAVTDTTPPTISPALRNYDLNAPADIATVITWNSAATVTDVVYGIYSLTADTEFVLAGNNLIIKNSYLSGLSLSEEDTLGFVIVFNTGATATLTITVVDGYVPSDDADLSSLSVNGTPVSGFDPDDTEYDVELPYGSVSAAVYATASDSANAQVDITQASSLPGNATITVTAEDGTTTKTYTINLTIDAAPTVPVSSITVTGTGGATSVQAGNTLQMLADVLPANATDDSVTWSIESSSGAGISISGLLTAAAAGTVTVRATANDGSGVYGERVITIAVTLPTFVAVTDITGVPATTTAGTPLTLSGTVAPANATNQTIVWSVRNAGATGATISGDTLSPTAAGTVVVRATITNGLTESTDYTQDFNIAVSAAPVTIYTINASAGSGGSISPSGAVSVTSGGSQTFTITPNSGYRINAVAVDGVGQGAISTYTFPNVTANHAITATFTYTSGGHGNGSGASSGGGSTTSSTPAYNAEVSIGNGSIMTRPVTVDKNSGSAVVDVGTGSNFTSGGQTTIIAVPSVPDVDTYILGIPVADLKTPDEQGKIAFQTNNGSVTVPSDMLTGVAGINGSKAQISVGQGDKSNLSADIKAAIGERPLVQLTLSIDGKQTDWSNTNAPVTVSIPYTPTAEEMANPESIVIWYIDGSGNAVSVPNGHYDPATGAVTFATTHFSGYAVAYNKVSFNDVAPSAWYYKAISFIAARGITTGMGGGKFNPNEKLTRGQFIVMLMKAYDIAPDENPTDNFEDAGSTYYTGYLAGAKRLGISAGVGNNLFIPEKEITRQEMFVLLYNALKVIGQLPQGDSDNELSDFSDAGPIDSWAKEAMTLLVETGTIGGNTGKLSPTSTATRAEMAQVLYQLNIG